MAIASLYPTIKPSLLLDFANSKKLDPRVTFTRSTTAVYYDGVTTAKAEENLLLQSQVFLPATWTLTNSSPTGTLGSELVTNGNFSSGSTGWTLDPNANVVAGELVASGVGAYGNLCSQPLVLSSGKVYAVTYTIVSMSSGAISAVFYTGANKALTSRTSPGTYTEYFLSGGTANFAIQASVLGATATIDNISIKELTVTYVTAPDGTTTATEFTADAANSTITQSVTAIAAEYTFSVYLRRVTGTGNIDITAHSGGTWVTQTITSSWARYTVTQTLTAGSRTPGIRIVTSGDQIEVWGAQLEQRSAATAYTPTTTQAITNYIPQLLTAPAGVPRFDHNPTTGESLGLLVEEQRTNLVLRSQEFDNAAWSNFYINITANAVVAPDGTLTGEKIAASTDNAFHLIQQNAGAAGSNTLSVYAKKAESQYLYLGKQFGDSATFNLTTGAVHSGSGTIAAVGNGWYRCSVVFTNNGNIEIGVARSDGVWANYVGDGYSGIFIWGAQVEAGAFATSYIPTTSASVTRTADDASMTGTNFSSWYAADQGSLFFDGVVRESSSGTYENIVLMANGSVGAGTGYGFNASGSGAQLYWRGPTSAIVFSSLSATPTSMKLAGAYAVNDYAATRDGASVSTSSTGPGENNVNRLNIGNVDALNPYNGTIKKIAYYPARLTNAQLQALTA